MLVASQLVYKSSTMNSTRCYANTRKDWMLLWALEESGDHLVSWLGIPVRELPVNRYMFGLDQGTVADRIALAFHPDDHGTW